MSVLLQGDSEDDRPFLKTVARGNRSYFLKWFRPRQTSFYVIR
ncbi:MAG TPA: hypothetical protein VGO56_02180 [Pyrinomonadaceae bacterium]|nr:hypothetical protein [Pyrinomonadaceae bacterium]